MRFKDDKMRKVLPYSTTNSVLYNKKDKAAQEAARIKLSCMSIAAFSALGYW